MADLKVPSLQHLARNWRNDANLVMRILVRLARNPPIFNYNPLFAAVRDLLVLGVPYQQVIEGIRRIKREDIRLNLLEVMPLIRDHFVGVSPDFFQGVERRLYPVGRGLMVPFEPPMIYGIGGQLYFPWFSFWRRNPLAKERLSLFVTLVDEIILQDPDLEDARFEVLDFSALDGERTLKIIDAREIPRVGDREKQEMLGIFAEGYFLAQSELRRQPEEPAEDREEKRDSDQLGLFDESST
jgi:hypothetical protein